MILSRAEDMWYVPRSPCGARRSVGFCQLQVKLLMEFKEDELALTFVTTYLGFGNRRSAVLRRPETIHLRFWVMWLLVKRDEPIRRVLLNLRLPATVLPPFLTLSVHITSKLITSCRHIFQKKAAPLAPYVIYAQVIDVAPFEVRIPPAGPEVNLRMEFKKDELALTF